MDNMLMGLFGLLLLASFISQRDKRKNDEDTCDLSDEDSTIFWLMMIIILMTTI
ncbi:MAG: hypothetical protein AAF846_19360 [Chloroflexota bacterium]